VGRVYAYIDGFNLYYGCLKGSSDRWLDVCALLTKYVAKDDRLEHVRYFTALVKDRNGDTGPRIRQQTYLRALTTSASLSIHYGQFLESQKNARLVRPPASGSPYVRVWKTEEKGSDVNVATFMLVDGFQAKYDKAVVVSNDSDLVEPVRQVRDVLGKPVMVLTPTTNKSRKPSSSLRGVASYVREIRRGALSGSQFPEQMQDKQGLITKPAEW